MSGIIALLPNHVANQIAAGEVVQRPASVVKELLENSLDAGATKIDLLLTDSGKTNITVVDNGSGMNEQDARMCFTRHATSKIKTADDLYNLVTAGFRGEALASIAAVSSVQMKTNATEEPLGIEVTMEPGEDLSIKPAAWNKGTSIAVKNLFHNIPARRKFLKNDRVELKHCIDEFQRIALIHPEIEWTMTSNGKVLFQLLPENFRKRITAIFGSKFNERLVPVKEETGVVQLSGFIVKPEWARKSRGEQFFFANGRFIKSPYLANAVKEAYEELITADQHPGYFLMLNVEPGSIDVNIHPTKTEVKFEDERAIYAVIRSAVRHALGQFNVSPTIDFEAEQSFSVPPLPKGSIPKPPTISVNPNFNPFEQDSIERPQLRTPMERYAVQQSEAELEDQAHQLPDSFEEDLTTFWDSEEGATAAQNTVLRWGENMVFTLGNKLLIANIKLAQKRIAYDQLMKNMQQGTGASQQLMFPTALEWSAADFELISGYWEELTAAGFDFGTENGNSDIELKGIPMNLAPNNAVDVLEQFLDQVKASGDSADANEVMQSLMVSMAHHMGPNAHPSNEELQALAQQLLSSSNPQYAPGGARIITELTAGDLSK